jgi:hypothetical protein
MWIKNSSTVATSNTAPMSTTFPIGTSSLPYVLQQPPIHAPCLLANHIINRVLGHCTPTFNLLGPYEYQEYSIKYNTSFNADGSTFKYNEYWIYEPLTPKASTDVV